MEFRVLGPLEVFDNGRPIELGARKPSALLAVLLLNANRVVPADVLVESLWGDRAPSTAAKALQVYVSQLRKTLGRERIVTRSPGYELRVDTDELDADRFERLVTAERYREALELWRGAALTDFVYEAFAQGDIARLEERRVACLDLRIAADLAQGLHASLIGELEALVREYPLRERVRAQLMLALYRSARQVDALDVYQAGRSLLSDELGLQPGSELRDLQRAILTQDPSLDLAEDSLPTAEIPEHDEGEPRPVLMREVRKTVTVLSFDMVAADDRQLDPESLGRLGDHAFDEVVPVLRAHGATVERSLGGGVTAVFGVPAVHEDDALRAVRAAAETRDRLASLGEEAAVGAPLTLRAGLGTGEVLTGGSSDGRPVATGEPVRSAIRLQRLAAAGEVLLDDRTLRVVREAVDVEILDGHSRLRSVELSGPLHRTRFDAPMVGRDRERGRLHGAFEQATSDRSCQLFTVLGAPGVGKSRLVHEFAASVPVDTLVARGRCLPYGEGISYWPVVEALREAVGLDDTVPPEENIATLAGSLEGTAEPVRVAERLGEIAGLTERASSADDLALAVQALVEALARRRPVLLVFDDIHWGEPTFLDLIDHLAVWTSDAPVLLVCLARPELLEARPGWGGGKPNATSVLLEPLSADESESLLDSLAGEGVLDEGTRDRIVEAAGGNPLFVEEMLALLLEGGRDRALVEIPPTIQALLATRLEHLSDDERVAVEAASVEGKVFHEASVAELTLRDDAATHDALLGLVRRGLVRVDAPVFSGEQAFRFRHLLIRDAAYESIPKGLRATLHARHAGWLEATMEGRAFELDEIVGYHYEQAYRCQADIGPIDDATRELGRLAATKLGAAGRRALLRSDGPAGVNLISRSVALLSPDDPLRVELVPGVRVVQGLPDLRWADRVLTEAVEAAATTGDRRLAAHALVQRGFLRLFVDDDVSPRELFDVAERAIAVFESEGDEPGLARAWRLVGQAHYLDRRAGSCADASERALEHAQKAGDRFEQREIAEWLVIALLLGPAPAELGHDRCMELMETDWADPLLSAEIAGVAAVFAAMRDRPAQAEVLLERARRDMVEADQWIWIVSFWESYMRLWNGEFAGAEATLRPAYEALGRMGERSHYSSIAHALASALYGQGRYDEAEALTYDCERASRPNDVHSQVLWRSIRAKVHARRGEFTEAERLSLAAVEYGQGSDFLHAYADALSDRAEVLALSGDAPGAVRELEHALRVYEDKGNLLGARLMRARVANLR